MPNIATHLKSSMERFIASPLSPKKELNVDLKSSMERFIDLNHCLSHQVCKHLKSSMERFIESIFFVPSRMNQI